MNLKKNYFLMLTSLASALGFSQTTISTVADFEMALNSANPGDVITVTDGVYLNADLDIDVNATAAAPVIIEAANPGAAFLEGNSRIEISGSYITFKGFVFQNPNNLEDGKTAGDDIDPVIRLNDCDFCVVENVKIDAYNVSTDSNNDFSVLSTFKWLLLDGQYNEIRYCSFLGKNGVGSIINDNRNADDKDLDENFASPDFLKIHHNYFADRVPVLGVVNEKNDQDAIRIGNSATSLGDSFTEVYENYFYNFVGEVEMISNKSGSNKYYNNTFRDYEGSLTLRHGDNCEVFGNFFFAEGNGFTAGIRVVGENHRIYNNYIQDINSRKLNADGSTSGSNATGAINVSNGVVDSPLNRYFQVKNTYIVNNTIVNCDLGIRIGTAFDFVEQSLPPENLVVSDNIIMNATNNGFQLTSVPTGAGSINEGNLNYNGSWDLTEGIDGNQTSTNPILTAGTDYYELTSGSPAIGAALGVYDFVSIDVFDGIRDATADVGAEEFAANGTRMPYTTADVGMTIGFGAVAVSAPTLVINPISEEIGKEANTVVFNVTSNVDWIVSENVDWLSVSTTSGSGTEAIVLTIDVNDSGTDRVGVITVAEVAGGDDLSATYSITQTTAFTPVEIQIVGDEAVGTQINDDGTFPNPPINAYNDNTANYWTGNAFDEPEVFITFDLECVHELTEIGVNFWKADERTTTFSIETSEDGVSFTAVIDSQQSTASGVTVDTEQIFDISGTSARFVKLIGLGNSAGSGWSSIANVNIYGNSECEDISNGDVLSIVDNELQSAGIQLYPIPVTDAVLNISSSRIELDIIDVYDISGQKIQSKNAQGVKNTTINTLGLSTGIYFLVIEDIGVSKFIVN